MDASSLNIFCPEHNQYVQHVCLVNQCYQKLMCELCLKKHKDVHRNMHTPLMELINNFKRFMKVKLENDQDLTNLHEQIKNGGRNLRGEDSKPSEIDYMMMQCVDGKDQEIKYNNFNEKSQLKKNALITNEVKIFTDELHLCLQSQQKKVLNFEKSITESMQNQLKRATSRKVLEQKFLKDSAIQMILDDLKNNNDRYNQLNKNLQKLHKGFLELKVSKKIFRDMCVDTQQRFRIFTKNISSYFDSEYNKLFAFMIDTNEALIEQAALEKQLQNDSVISPSLVSPTKSHFSGFSVDLANKGLKIPDKKDPNVYMNKMIHELQQINLDTRKISQKKETYPLDVQLQNIQNDNTNNNSNNSDQQPGIQHMFLNNRNNSLSSFTPIRNIKQANQQQPQSDQFSLQNSINNTNLKSQINPQIAQNNLSNNFASSSFGGTPSKKKVQLNQITTYSPQQLSQFQQQSQQQNNNNNNNIPKIQKNQLLQRVNFQKKELKMNLERIEAMRFNSIQNQISNIMTQPKKNKDNNQPISLKSLTFLYSVPNLINQSNSTSQTLQSSEQLYQQQSTTLSPTKKSVNFRIHTSSSSSQQFPPSNNNINNKQKFIESEPFQDISEASDMLNRQTERQVNRQLAAVNNRLMKRNSLLSQGSFTLPKEQIQQLQSVNESSICYEMSSSNTDYKSINIIQLSTNSYLRTYGFLEQLNLNFQYCSHPFQNFQSTQLKQKKLQNQMSKENNEESNKNNNLKQQQQQYYEIKKTENSFIMNYIKENIDESIIIGLEELSNSRFLTIHQNGSIYVWQIVEMNSNNITITKQKDISFPKNIYCYQEVNSHEDIKIKNINQSSQTFDPILILAGQNDLNETTLTIVRYESKKNKFTEIDSFRSYHGSGAISEIQVIWDKQFQKKNIPNSLQLTTDAYYVFTLNLFDYNNEDDDYYDGASSDLEFKQQQQQFHTIPTILVQRISFHRDKQGSSQIQLITKIRIKNNLIIQRIMYDSTNDCLWGHSDYILFKWRINFMSKCLENQETLPLCTQPNDIITSMQLNHSIIMLSSLQGNIWGVDVMLNKVISTDCQRIKYSSINHYTKIQGKDPIFIVSGSKIYLTPNNIRTLNNSNNKKSQNNTDDQTRNNSSINSTQQFNGSNSINNNTTTRNKEQQQVQVQDCDYYFLYSTLSQSGVKIFCFDSEFKEVMSHIPGQENHLQQIISLNKENLILSIEDFNSIRIWKNEFI